MSTHTCHWPGCPAVVLPKLWGCRAHWYKLPQHLRQDILDAYVPGQELTKTPSAAYMQAARAVQAWIVAHEAQQPQGRLL